MQRTVKRLGLVGGIGPASTLDYYKGINEGYRQRLSITGNGNPPLVIDSLDLNDVYTLASQQAWEPFAQLFVDSLHRLAAAGAEVAAMCANTAHIVFDEVARRSPIPLVSIVEATSRAAVAQRGTGAIIMGTAFTMNSTLFNDGFARVDLPAWAPTPEERTAIHNIIFPNLQANIILPEDKATVLAIANRMKADYGADTLVLGCTELPLLIKPDDFDGLVLDTTQIHIDAILDTMFDGS